VATEELLRTHLFGPERAAEAIVTEMTHESGSKSIIGHAIFFKSFSTFLALPGIYLEDIYVQKQHRNQGHGKAMLRYLADLVVTRGYGRLEWAVLDWNAPSIAFYKSIGAVPMDDWTSYRLTGDALKAFAAK
jgi:GNAT superfamily N-acetyltransferase